eukprot:1255527-Amphidinium_carterae.1
MAEDQQSEPSASTGPAPGVPNGPPLQQRLREQRRWIFQQRSTVPNRRPDDWPFAGHCFEA